MDEGLLRFSGTPIMKVVMTPDGAPGDYVVSFTG